MNKKDIVIGFVVLGLLAVLIYRLQTPEFNEELQVPQTLSVEDTIEEKFNLNIPEDVDKAELKDVSGGDASAIATRKFLPAQAGENGQFTHTILADLPDLEAGKNYEGRLIQNDNEINTGALRVAKGGYLLEYKSDQDFSTYNKVKIILDGQIVLEGDF